MTAHRKARAHLSSVHVDVFLDEVDMDPVVLEMANRNGRAHVCWSPATMLGVMPKANFSRRPIRSAPLFEGRALPGVGRADWSALYPQNRTV